VADPMPAWPGGPGDLAMRRKYRLVERKESLLAARLEAGRTTTASDESEPGGRYIVDGFLCDANGDLFGRHGRRIAPRQPPTPKDDTEATDLADPPYGQGRRLPRAW
jgi:hypothetical protein